MVALIHGLVLTIMIEQCMLSREMGADPKLWQQK